MIITCVIVIKQRHLADDLSHPTSDSGAIRCMKHTPSQLSASEVGFWCFVRP